MALRIVEQAGRTDVGRQRSANEDSLVVDPPLFAVADGMGGAKAGEVASAVAVEAVEGATESGEPAEAQLASIVRQANRRIYDLAVADESRRGMGTTLTLAKVHGDEVSLAHVGDSRAYRLRDGKLEQLTRDHSLVAELERSGQITPEAAEHHPQRSIITRALGPEPDVEVDTYTLAGREGDVFLICSDGLTSMISDDEVGSILRSAGSLDEAADELVRAANQSGGKDNITVILFRLGEGEAAEATAPAAPAPADEDTIVGEISAADVAAAGAGAEPAGRAEDEPLTALGDAPADATIVRPPAPRSATPAPAAAPPRRRRRGRRFVGALVALLLVARGDRRPLRPQPSGLLHRHQRRGPRHRLQGPAVRAAARDQPVRGGVRERDARARHPRRAPQAGARPRVAQPRRRGGPRARARARPARCRGAGN